MIISIHTCMFIINNNDTLVSPELSKVSNKHRKLNILFYKHCNKTKSAIFTFFRFLISSGHSLMMKVFKSKKFSGTYIKNKSANL